MEERTTGGEPQDELPLGGIAFAALDQLRLDVPFDIPRTSPAWEKLRFGVHLILDRMRLASLLLAGSVSADDLAFLEQWVTTQIEDYRVDAAD